jgi:periplasmic protein TonB
MTTLEFTQLIGNSGPHKAHSWTVSLMCHVLAVGCAVALMTEIDKPALPDSFRWEVSMVESPAPIEPAPPEALPTKPVVHPPHPLVKPVTPIQQTVQTAVYDVPLPVETVQQTTQDAVTRVISSKQVPMIAHTPSQSPVTASLEYAEPIHERAEEVVQTSPSMIEHRAVQQRLVQYRQTQTDYGWLRNALWGRIEELKRYPAEARANHWEGKVVVEVVIRDDGEVVGIKISESSGRAILDQEALTVMRRASPLKLKHSLGRPSVTLLVPISYKLDG